jgi:hypothetical protein
VQKPRNPRYFPAMKVRGHRRRQVAPYHRLQRGFDQIAEAASVTAASFNQLVLAAVLGGRRRARKAADVDAD